MHVGDVTHLSKETIHLASGETLAVDGLVCATGWKQRPPIRFLPDGIDVELGISQKDPDCLRSVVQHADEEILGRFPRIKDQPIVTKHQDLVAEKAPLRLFRFMAPPTLALERNIAFSGLLFVVPTASCAQIQALWIATYLEGDLAISAQPPPYASRTNSTGNQQAENILWESVLHSQYCKWRYPRGAGANCPDFVFDAVPYFDLLLKELGLQSRRKPTMLTEWLDGYVPRDYALLLEEWKAARKAQQDRALKQD